jgi:predicted TIM-barrel fold metal-dependent hydrolase
MIGGYSVTDLHVHLQPWDMLREEVRARMEGGRTDLARIRACMESPRALLRLLDETGIERAGVVNYVAPDVMGFTPDVNAWAARYCGEAPHRLIAIGSVHPALTDDPGGEAERLLDRGIRGFKVHPPHQEFPANAHRTGGAAAGIGEVYRVAQERGAPVMVHTGTSIFPGARNVYADPMPCDDVAVDFPRLPLILAHAGRPLHCETAFFLARRHPQVRLDLSGIPPRRLLEHLPRLAEIADRCLWGTDWPGPGVPGLRRNVEDFLALGLPEAACRAILHDNAARLFP